MSADQDAKISESVLTRIILDDLGFSYSSTMLIGSWRAKGTTS